MNKPNLTLFKFILFLSHKINLKYSFQIYLLRYLSFQSRHIAERIIHFLISFDSDREFRFESWFIETGERLPRINRFKMSGSQPS